MNTQATPCSKLLNLIIGLVLVLPLLVACGSSKPNSVTTPTISIDGDKCTYTGPQSIPTGKVTIDWVVNNKDHDKYGLVIVTLNEGKTFEDIDKWPSSDPPPWITIVGIAEAAPNSRQQVTAQITEGPIYFVCFYSPPDTKFDTSGPVAVEGAKPTEIPLATITPHVAPTVAAHPRPVVIDTDMAADDWMAILYLLQRTDISIKAITVSGTGETHCAPGIQHALGLVALANHAPVPVACGRETPLAGNHTFPDDWRQSVDTLMGTGLSLPEGQNPASGKTAVELLTATIQTSPEKIALLTLGPLTNVADLLQNTPSAAENIEMIYVMGGAVHVPGNLSVAISGNQVSEWNIYVDPHAANVVFKAGIPVMLVPLDATNQVKITDDFYRLLQASHLTPEATWVFDLFTKEQGYFQSGNNYFWDPLTAAILTDESLATYKQEALCVVEEEGPQNGQTKVTTGCPNIRVAVSADRARFEQAFLDTLNNP